jgi:hypothetical protein
MIGLSNHTMGASERPEGLPLAVVVVVVVRE